uniref:Uncharacterized protein n=1 Tax=Tanacetum cinerariifolium TaxID=118510 RepID=A0A699IIY5_TANCI|nr:hypothetical protein [Tanacetum cinerariifolium]
MTLTFADTHNMVAYLTKSDASEGFDQIIDFLNASSIKKKMIITEATIREALRLDDAESIDCLTNEEIFTELSRMGKGIFGVETPLFEGMIVAQQADYVADEGAASVDVDDVLDVKAEPSIPPPPSHELPSTSQFIPTLPPSPIGQEVGEEEQVKSIWVKEIEKDEDVTLKDVAVVEKTAEIEENADDDELEPTELKKVVEVVTTAKLMTKVVTVASASITGATTSITAALSAARRRKGVVIRDPKETATPSIIIHSKPKSKDKGKGIMVKEPKPRKEKEENDVLRYQELKRKPQTEAQARKNMMIYLRNIDVFKMDYFKGMRYDDIRPIFEKYFNSNMAFLEKTKEQLEEEESRALKRNTKSSKEKAAKKQKLDEKVEELKKHLQIVPNNDDDVYTEAITLAIKVLVVDYKIYSENNKLYFKIIRVDGTHQLFMSFLSLLRNFDIEDLEVLWQIVKERFASSKPKNFSDDFLLTTLTYMFKKPDVEAQLLLSVQVVSDVQIVTTVSVRVNTVMYKLRLVSQDDESNAYNRQDGCGAIVGAKTSSEAINDADTSAVVHVEETKSARGIVLENKEDPSDTSIDGEHMDVVSHLEENTGPNEKEDPLDISIDGEHIEGFVITQSHKRRNVEFKPEINKKM